MTSRSKTGVKAPPAYASSVDVEQNEMPSVQKLVDGIQNVNAPFFFFVQLGILCFSVTCFWWWAIYMFSDDYNDYNPYIPFIPTLSWLFLLWVWWMYDFFKAEERIINAAGGGAAGFEAMFTVDRIQIVLNWLLCTWVTLFTVMLIGYMTYYHYDFHVLSPAMMWISACAMLLTVFVSNQIRRIRHNYAKKAL